MNILGEGISYGDQRGKGLVIKLLVRSEKPGFGSTKASFNAGLICVPNAVLITHERSMPSGPVNVSTTIPNDSHMPRGV